MTVPNAAAHLHRRLQTLDPSPSSPQPPQKIVVLAGPHKTASSTTQAQITKLADADALGRYEWKTHSNGSHRKEAYVKLANCLVDDATYPSDDSSGDEDLRECIDKYASSFDETWGRGKSVLIAAELLGSASVSPVGSGVIRGLKSALPWRRGTDGRKEEDVLTAVLNFRSNRLDHLVSTWGQHNFKAEAAKRKRIKGIRKQRKEKRHDRAEATDSADADDDSADEADATRRNLRGDEEEYTLRSFPEWICSMDCALTRPKLNLNVVNTLGQAAAYRRANFTTIIVDMGGAERDGIDVANVPACEVLNLPCVGGVPEEIMKKPLGVRPHAELGVSNRTKGEIEGILRRMDCAYEYLMEDEHVEVLHRTEGMFGGCGRWEGFPEIDHRGACSLIQNAVGCGTSDNGTVALPESIPAVPYPVADPSNDATGTGTMPPYAPSLRTEDGAGDRRRDGPPPTGTQLGVWTVLPAIGFFFGYRAAVRSRRTSTPFVK